MSSSVRVTLKSICSLIADCPHSTPFWTDSGYLVIRNQNIKNGQLNLSERSYTDHAHYLIRVRRAKPQFGDLIFTREAPMGDVCMVPEGLECCVGQRQVLLRPDPEKVIPRYLLYAIQSPEVQHQISWSEGTGSTVSNVRIPVLEKLKIPLRHMSEQVEVATLLGALDDRITLLRETNATLEAIAQALFKSWFVDFDPVRAKQEGRTPEGMDEATAALFPDSFEESEVGLVPKGWRVGTIGLIADVIDCLHAKKPDLLESGKPFLQLNNIRDDGLLDISKLAFISEPYYQKWISRIEVSGGDCVITNVGRVGAVSQIPNGFRAAMGRNMTAIRMKPNYPYSTYLIELLLSPWMKTEIATKTDVGTILDALNVKSIPRLRCIVAKAEVMVAFESITRPLRASMEMNLARAQTLATLRDTLLPRLISGQLRLPEAEAMVEAAP